MPDRAAVRIEPNPKWIRGTVGGTTVVDSRRSRLVWEIPHYPAWYFPVDDVAAGLAATGRTEPSDARGPATWFDLELDDRVVTDAGYRHLEAPDEVLRDLVRLRWDALDHWFEEEVEVFVHPRNPHTRVDVLASARHVTVSIDGTTVADSARPTVLFETGLPPRYYLPPHDVRMDLLRPSDTSTACPYKGFAHHWSAMIDGTEHPDVAWGYRTPLPESIGIAGLVCFYDERVDVAVDGARQPRPRTPFSC